MAITATRAVILGFGPDQIVLDANHLAARESAKCQQVDNAKVSASIRAARHVTQDLHGSTYGRSGSKTSSAPVLTAMDLTNGRALGAGELNRQRSKSASILNAAGKQTAAGKRAYERNSKEDSFEELVAACPGYNLSEATRRRLGLNRYSNNARAVAPPARPHLQIEDVSAISGHCVLNKFSGKSEMRRLARWMSDQPRKDANEDEQL